MDDKGSIKDLISALTEIFETDDDFSRIIELLPMKFRVSKSEDSSCGTHSTFALPSEILKKRDEYQQAFDIEFHDGWAATKAYLPSEDLHRLFKNLANTPCIEETTFPYLEDDYETFLDIFLDAILEKRDGLMLVDEFDQITFLHLELLHSIANGLTRLAFEQANQAGAKVYKIENLNKDFEAIVQEFLTKNRQHFERAIFLGIDCHLTSKPLYAIYLVRTKDSDAKFFSGDEQFAEFEVEACSELTEAMDGNFTCGAIGNKDAIATQLLPSVLPKPLFPSFTHEKSAEFISLN